MTWRDSSRAWVARPKKRVHTRGGNRLHSQLPSERNYLQSTRVYGNYQLMIAVNSSTVNNRPPPGTIQSQVRWTPGGKERPAEDGGGGDCHHNLLPPQVFVSVCSSKSGKTFAGEIRSNWTWSSCRRPEKKYCSSTWKKVGQPEEGRRSIGLNSQSDRMFTLFFHPNLQLTHSVLQCNHSPNHHRFVQNSALVQLFVPFSSINASQRDNLKPCRSCI